MRVSKIVSTSNETYYFIFSAFANEIELKILRNGKIWKPSARLNHVNKPKARANESWSDYLNSLLLSLTPSDQDYNEKNYEYEIKDNNSEPSILNVKINKSIENSENKLLLITFKLEQAIDVEGETLTELFDVIHDQMNDQRREIIQLTAIHRIESSKINELGEQIKHNELSYQQREIENLQKFVSLINAKKRKLSLPISHSSGKRVNAASGYDSNESRVYNSDDDEISVPKVTKVVKKTVKAAKPVKPKPPPKPRATRGKAKVVTQSVYDLESETEEEDEPIAFDDDEDEESVVMNVEEDDEIEEIIPVSNKRMKRSISEMSEVEVVTVSQPLPVITLTSSIQSTTSIPTTVKPISKVRKSRLAQNMDDEIANNVKAVENSNNNENDISSYMF